MIKIKNFLPKKDIMRLYLIVIASFVIALLEVIGIGSIPAIIILLQDKVRFYNYLNSLDGNISNYLKIQNEFYFLHIFLIFFILKNLASILLVWYENIFINSLHENISEKIYSHYIFKNFLDFINIPRALIVNNLSKEVDHFVILLKSLIIIYRESIIGIFMISLLLYTSPGISMMIIFILILILLTFYFSLKKIVSQSGVLANQYRKKQINFISQILENFKYIKFYKKENFFIKNYTKLIKLLLKQELQMKLISALPRPIMEIFAVCSTFGILFFFLTRGESINDFLPIISLIVLIIIRLIPSFNQISAGLTICKFYLPAAIQFQKTIFNISLSESNLLINPKANSKIKNLFLKEKIHFNNLSFAYSAKYPNVLEKINFEIEAQSIVGITGHSGSGKSTIIDLLLGFIEPTEGSINIDNMKLQSQLDYHYNKIGFVPQNINLLNDSIRKNITFLSDEPENKENLKKAIEMSALNSFVESLPNKLDSIVGHDGVNMSGGQKQRIAIARCLYNLPKLIIMDEPTSSLDNQTEKEIMETIAGIKNKITIILISHKISVISKCDNILYLKDDKQYDYGSFFKLSTKYPDYFVNGK
jgi:ABC-type multidrug transport system fused ATPase/permease subunit